MDAMFKFHKFGFRSVAVVCDNASSNLSMIKVLSGSEAKGIWVRNKCYILHAMYITFIYDENLRTLPAGMIVVKVIHTSSLYSLGLLAHTQNDVSTSLSVQCAKSVKLFFFFHL